MDDYGLHLMLDLSGCRSNLNEPMQIKKFLEEIVDKIEMTPIMPAQIYLYPSHAKPEEWGVSGLQMIAESHISVHTYPENGWLFGDVFSCKSFDTERALLLFTKFFEPSHTKWWIQTRGEGFPRSTT